MAAAWCEAHTSLQNGPQREPIVVGVQAIVADLPADLSAVPMHGKQVYGGIRAGAAESRRQQSGVKSVTGRASCCAPETVCWSSLLEVRR